MSRVSRACFVLSTLAALAPACAKPFLVEGDLSPPPRPGGSAGLRAGFGRADITPPPGVGLAGNGPEGRRATGYRLRLYARALVLEDPGGNRIALVVADLGLGSALLHRRVAALTAAADSIGIDRLVLTVTHIHSGPGHYFEAAALNEQSSSVVGYDPVLLERKSILVLTKCDQLPGGVTGVDPELLKLHEPTVAISAVARQGLDQLLGKVAMVLRA